MQEQSTGRMELIPLAVKKSTSTSTEEPQASTSTTIFIIENEANCSTARKPSSSIADDILGDIGIFTHFVRSEDSVITLPVVCVDAEISTDISQIADTASNKSLQQDIVEVNQDIVGSNQNIVEANQVRVETNQGIVEVNQDIVEVNQDIVEVNQDIVKVNQDIVKVNQDIVGSNQNIVEANQDIVEVNQDIGPELECVQRDNGYEESFIQEVLTSNGIPNRTTYLTRKPSRYIHTHLKLMYLIGSSTFSTNDKNVLSYYFPFGMSFWTKLLQRVCFVSLIILSILQSICDAKYCCLWFLYEGGLNKLVRAAFNLTCLVSSAYGAYIFCYKGNDLLKIVNAMDKYEENWAVQPTSCSITLALFIITTFLAFLKPILIVDFQETSFETVMLQGSYTISEDLLLWSPKNLNISSNQLGVEYGTNLSSTTISMGAFKLARDFAFNLQQGLIWDIFANIILAMSSWILVFMLFVNSVQDNIDENNLEDKEKLQNMRVVVWKMYRGIRNVFASVNEVFGPLLMLFHINNVLRYAFLMERCIFPDDATAFTYIHLLYDIVKSELIYLMATNISQKNKLIRKWLRNWAEETGSIDLGNRKLDITVVLDELDEEPLGLGQGDFVVDQGFHFGILGLVSSLFVILATKTGVRA